MITIFHIIQHKLDQIAMYRTVTLGLVFLVGVSLTLALFELSPYAMTEQVVSLVVALVTAFGLNVLCAKLWGVPANHESAVITALIVFFLVIPGFTLVDQWQIAAVTTAAILSKFILVWRGQHIVNPAAFGALALSVTGVVESAWWVGSPQLFVPLVLVGVLVVMKIRKWTPVLWFIGAAFVVYMLESWRLGFDVVAALPVFFTSWPALFLAFFMLTEPFTMPPTKKLQAWYGGFIGVLSSVAFLAPVITMSPELALVIGNVLFWPSTLQQKLKLKLTESREIALHTWEFVFEKPAGMRFQSGQYLEWMLPHAAADNRGLRRYFTIASAPEEPELRLAVRFTETGGSSYKKALLAMNAGDIIIASQCAGDFLLPKQPGERKLAFVAGGIGVTPFRSHVAQLAAADQSADVVMYYCNNTSAEIAYDDFFSESAIKLVHVLAKEERDGYEHGYLTPDIIERYTPDYLERMWYLSGPPGMVNAYTALLREAGVPQRQIVRDFFPGLA